MADVTFPATVTVTEEADGDGVPVIEAEIVVAPSVGLLELPPGPEGDPGPPGVPVSPFIKVGTIANVGARPSGLVDADRGKWWHRLDNDSMDFWNGSAWINTGADTVGPTGPTAEANTLTPLDVITQDTITVPAVVISPTSGSSDQTIQVTVPAGVRGATGAAGASGTILTSPDFDGSVGPVKRSMFAYNGVTRRFHATPPPCGYGPWHWTETNFAASSTTTTSYTLLTVTIPALPFDWRPMCHGAVEILSAANTFGYAVVRMNDANGVMLGLGINPFPTTYDMVDIDMHYGNPNCVNLSPSSDYAVVRSGFPQTIVVRLETFYGDGGTIGHHKTGASFTVYAMPVSL